jgi:hypothetical protein
MTMLAVAVVGAGCGDNNGAGGPPAPTLDPPPVGLGIQIKMSSTIAARFETERCMFYRVPAEGLYIQRQEIRYTPGSHHVLVFKTPYTEVPTTTISGETIDTSGVFDCGKNGATGDWDVQGVAGGAQSASGPTAFEGLPEDTAYKVDGGSLLLVNAHYLNASDSALTAEIYINLYTVPAAQVTREAGIFFLYNPFIYVPAGLPAVAREVCTVSAEVTLVNAQSHMHARGVGYLANLVDASDAQVKELYTTTSWEHVVSRHMDPPVTISPGQKIDFRCDYMNKENRAVSQGRTTRDEMCMFIGLYYPKDTKSEVCSRTDGWDGRQLGGTWIGNGTAAGLATAACLQAATLSTAAMGDFDKCVVSACPSISAQTSTAARCLASKGMGQCEAECAGTEITEDCRTCVRPHCTDVMTALAGATCS